MNRVAALVCMLWMAMTATSWAQDCPRAYQVVPGDSLSRIAESEYQNGLLWSQIYAFNRALIGDDPDTILHGTVIELPCISGAENAADAGLASSLRPPQQAVSENTNVDKPAAVLLVNQVDLAPFTGETLPEKGLLVELVEAALLASDPNRIVQIVSEGSPPPVSSGFTATSLEVPVLRMSRDDPAEQQDCAARIYSAPLFEALMVVYVHKDKPIPMSDPRDMHGHRLCRPAGLSLQMLDAQGRDWLSSGNVSLIQPATASACMQALAEGEVDGVVLNEFTGQAALKDFDPDAEIMPLDRVPLGIATFHAAVSVDATAGPELINDLNTGLEIVRATGTARTILKRHLNAHWAGS